MLLVEQNAAMALRSPSHGYVMETGRVVKDGPAAELLADQDIQEFYLGVGETGPALVPRRQVLPAPEAVERVTPRPTPAASAASRDVTLRFGGVTALDGVSLRRPARRAVRGHRPERRRQDLDLQLPQRRLPAAGGLDPLDGDELVGRAPPAVARARRRAHVPEPRAVREPDGDRQPHARPPPPHADRLPRRRAVVGPRASARRSRTAPRSRRSSSCSSSSPTATRPPACCRTGPEAHRARPRAGDGAEAAAARRAGRRHEPRGDRGHGALHPRDARARSTSR